MMQNALDSDRSYQIFRREADNTTVCIEVVKGSHEARSRIEQTRATSPGSELFIFDPLTEKVIEPSASANASDPLTPSPRSGYCCRRFAARSPRFGALFLTQSRDLAP
jgi:hypothetical protein